MLEGTHLRLHRNSFVRNADSDAAGLIAGFDGQRWRMLVGREEQLVAEDSIQLCFSVLPSSCSKVAGYVKVAQEGAQGCCGRGLVAKQDIKRGYPIVEEPPLFVVRNSVSPLEQHGERWRAYKMLAAKASAGSDTPWAKAYTAFEDLVAHKSSFCCQRDAARRDAARQIAAQEAEGMSEQEQESYVARVQDVIDRFAANEYGFDNLAGTNPGQSSWEANGLYCFTSRINHCCDPNSKVITKETFCKLNNRPFQVDRDGGVVVFIAIRDIKDGERITASYSDLVSCGSKRADQGDGQERPPVQQRRDRSGRGSENGWWQAILRQ